MSVNAFQHFIGFEDYESGAATVAHPEWQEN
jgi:hypothetical protein